MIVGAGWWMVFLYYTMGRQSPSTETTQAQWCPERQVYVNGRVPNASDEAELLLKQLQQESSGHLLLFGYGSLCWNPGSPHRDTLAMTHLGVTSRVASAVGYRRCWAQKSADHRGTPDFPGVVCTLLADAEVARLYGPADVQTQVVHRTTGLLFSVPAALVPQVLMELDMREKGVRS
jgi:cation transport regulator ChaC